MGLAPKCLEGKFDCFAWDRAECSILTSTNFKGRSCPFYKSQEQYEEELEKYGGIKDGKNSKRK